MRLNAHILMDELANRYQVTYFGPVVTQLHLKRPEIYNIYQSNVPFSKNRTYCLLTDMLPDDPICEPGVLLLCIGQEIPERYCQGNIQCICLQEDPKQIIEIFNTVQRIFDKYDDWEYKLQSILHSTASIQEMVDCCEEILPNPIIVIDADLRFLGRSRIVDIDPALATYRSGKDGKVRLDNLKPYLSFRDTYTKAGPLFYDNNRVYIWDVWLHDRYLGNVTIPCVYHKYRKSDRWILSILEPYIANALTRYSNNPQLRENILRNTFRDLLDNKPLGEEARRILADYTEKAVCLKMKFQKYHAHSQPVSLYCSYIENTLPNCICFEHASSIIAFADISEPESEMILTNKVEHLAEELSLIAGISHPFSELVMAQYYALQAKEALRTLQQRKTSQRVAFFGDHVLDFMLRQTTATMPLDTLYSIGIRRILDHDSQSKVSFAKTLHTYLSNAMNITKTALDLQIHRSSFLERLRSIEALLDTDLDDPRVRLYLQLILECYLAES